MGVWRRGSGFQNDETTGHVELVGSRASEHANRPRLRRGRVAKTTAMPNLVRDGDGVRNGVKSTISERSVWRRGRAPSPALGTRPHVGSVSSHHVFESSYSRLCSHPEWAAPTNRPGWTAVSLPFTNTTRPIAVTRAHRPLVLPTSIAFRKASPLSIRKQALRHRCLPLCACAPVQDKCTAACLNPPA